MSTNVTPIAKARTPIAKVSAKDRNKAPNGFIRIERDVWRSPEVEALSPVAKLTLVELHYCFTGKNNGQLCLPYGHLTQRLHCSRSTVERALRELREAGLIETTVSGSFDHKAGARRGIGSQYRLIHI